MAMTQRRWILQRVVGFSRWFIAVLWASFGQTACDVPAVTLVDPDVDGDQQSGLTITVQLDDSALAATLGWSDGVPRAEIQLHRIIDQFVPITVYTDSIGSARVRSLHPGWYWIAAKRVLPEEEAGPAGGFARAFGDGLKYYMRVTGRVELNLRIDRPGSVVFSEYYSGGSGLTVDYQWAQFFELYNNSDTTVYLDRMLWGDGSRGGRGAPCTEWAAFREDPLGLWSFEFYQFPGRGRDFPMAPGQAVTIALDAVDHSVVDRTLPDLAHVDFELEGAVDADNPDVPNLVSVGLHSDFRGHGMWTTANTVQFLALPADPSNLVTAFDPSGYRKTRIPAELIVDVMHGDAFVSPTSAYPPTLVWEHYCDWVNREFDRLEAAYFDGKLALHRKVLRFSDGGQPVLQDLNTSYWDFLLAPYNPGTIEH